MQHFLGKLTILFYVSFAVLKAAAPYNQAQKSSKLHTTINTIKQLIKQDVVLEDVLITGSEPPEELLQKIGIAASATRFPEIAKTLNTVLKPEIENLLFGIPVESLPMDAKIAPDAPREQVAVEPPMAEAMFRRTPIEKHDTPHQSATACTNNCPHLKELKLLREELAKIKAVEAERLKTTNATFANQLHQAKKECLTHEALTKSLKDQILSFQQELHKVNKDSLALHVNASQQTKMDSMRSFFAQQINNLDRLCGNLVKLVNECQKFCDELDWALNHAIPSDPHEAKAKEREAWLSIKQINRLMQEMQQLALEINDVRVLAVQTKFDLDTRYTAAKKRQTT